MTAPRRVVLLCGPPGAGKTTLARKSGLTVFDRDDPHWSTDREFTAALHRLGADPLAQAVVIRSGATSSARAATARMIRATKTYVVMTSAEECQRRAHGRGRSDSWRTKAAIPRWFADFDRHDGAPDFPGWVMTDPASALGADAALRPSRNW